MFKSRNSVIILLFAIDLLSLLLLIAVTFLRPSSDNSITSVKNSKASVPFQPLTLERIFLPQHQLSKDIPQEKLRVLVATGDIIPARMVNFTEVQKNNFLWPYEKINSYLKGADIVFANLETPFFEDCKPQMQGMSFCGDPKNIQGLHFTGVNVVSLANNHAGNGGIAGIESTRKLLDQANILVTGISGPVFKEVKGLRFAFLGYNNIGASEDGISWADPDIVTKEIAQTKAKADIVVVTFHWGTEYVSQPTEEQRQLAHLAIDSGADLIIGNHPHWIQPVEIYKGKVITYAHGNFVFDQIWSQETREGVIGKYTFYDKQLIDVDFTPILIEDYGQPSLATGSSIIGKMHKESVRLSQDTGVAP